MAGPEPRVSVLDRLMPELYDEPVEDAARARTGLWFHDERGEAEVQVIDALGHEALERKRIAHLQCSDRGRRPLASEVV